MNVDDAVEIRRFALTTPDPQSLNKKAHRIRFRIPVLYSENVRDIFCYLFTYTIFIQYT